jgi:hypothetical protein
MDRDSRMMREGREAVSSCENAIGIQTMDDVNFVAPRRQAVNQAVNVHGITSEAVRRIESCKMAEAQYP